MHRLLASPSNPIAINKLIFLRRYVNLTVTSVSLAYLIEPIEEPVSKHLMPVSLYIHNDFNFDLYLVASSAVN